MNNEKKMHTCTRRPLTTDRSYDLIVHMLLIAMLPSRRRPGPVNFSLPICKKNIGRKVVSKEQAGENNL